MRRLPSSTIFTAEQAAACRWSPSALRNAVATGRLVRVLRGVYAAPGQPTGPELAARAAACRYPAAVVSDRSATLLHGLPIVGARPLVPELSVSPRYTAVAALDAALHSRTVTRADIKDVLLHCWNWPRIARAHRAFELSDGRAESPLESVSRLAIGHLGLPAPDLQKDVVGAFDQVVGRVDFYWDDVGVAGEADGKLKYRGGDALSAEKERQEQLEDLGLVIVRWGWDDAYRHPNRLRQRLQRGFERGLARDRSGFLRLWSL